MLKTTGERPNTGKAYVIFYSAGAWALLFGTSCGGSVEYAPKISTLSSIGLSLYEECRNFIQFNDSKENQFGILSIKLQETN